MPTKPYECLRPETQHVIDAMILGTEASRILNRTMITDGRDAFLGDTLQLVDYLREYYALDIQTHHPKTDWSNPTAIIKSAMDIQAHIDGMKHAIPDLQELIEFLTNLPYPEQDAGRSR